MLHVVGQKCKRWRQEKGYTQIQVAKETGYVQSNIVNFESGRNDNSRILLWYIMHGFDPVTELKGLVKYGV